MRAGGSRQEKDVFSDILYKCGEYRGSFCSAVLDSVCPEKSKEETALERGAHPKIVMFSEYGFEKRNPLSPPPGVKWMCLNKKAGRRFMESETVAT